MTLATDISSHRDGQTVGVPCPPLKLPSHLLNHPQTRRSSRACSPASVPRIPKGAGQGSPRLELFFVSVQRGFVFSPCALLPSWSIPCTDAAQPAVPNPPLTSRYSLASLPPASPDALSFPFTKGLLLTSRIFPVSLIRHEPN